MVERIQKSVSNIYQKVQETGNIPDCLNTIMQELSLFSSCSALALNIDGKVLAYKLWAKHPMLTIEKPFNEQLKQLLDIKYNLMLEHFFVKTEQLSRYYAVVFPLVAAMERLGTIVMYKDECFNNEDLFITEICALVSTLNMHRHRVEKDIELTQKVSIVKSAIDTLSYSELEAVIEIFKELHGHEGLVVASKVAEKARLTRSVIVNALRKFESAGIIESRSLGMKGTYIKVINTLLLDELNKFKR